MIRVNEVKLTAVHLIRTMLTRIGSTAAAAQWHAAVGARPLCGLHHLFVLGATVLEPDFHLQRKEKKGTLAVKSQLWLSTIDKR